MTDTKFSTLDMVQEEAGNVGTESPQATTRLGPSVETSGTRRGDSTDDGRNVRRFSFRTKIRVEGSDRTVDSLVDVRAYLVSKRNNIHVRSSSVRMSDSHAMNGSQLPLTYCRC